MTGGEGSTTDGDGGLIQSSLHKEFEDEGMIWEYCCEGLIASFDISFSVWISLCSFILSAIVAFVKVWISRAVQRSTLQ